MNQKHFLVIIFFFLSKIAFACSCGPWVEDFYQNVSKHSTNGVVRIDSFYFIDDPGCFEPAPMAIVTLVKGFNFLDKFDGDTILLFGQDGFNCAESLSQFNNGDTLVVALSKWRPCISTELMYNIPFATSFACGTHFLRITNGMHEGLSLIEIEQKIYGIITSVSDLDMLNQVQIYPNPFSNWISIFTPSMILNLEIINSLGQEVYTAICNSEKKTIDLSNLPGGLYIATFHAKGIRRRSFILIKK